MIFWYICTAWYWCIDMCWYQSLFIWLNVLN